MKINVENNQIDKNVEKMKQKENWKIPRKKTNKTIGN